MARQAKTKTKREQNGATVGFEQKLWQADYVLANPPFNDSDWRGELLKDDKRWVYGVPPAGNANYAWGQHFIHHLAPHGMAGFVLAITASLNHSFCISGL